MKHERLRKEIAASCLDMNNRGINQGTSGNISLRHDDGMLITPTSVPYDAMTAEQIVFMKMDGAFAEGQRPCWAIGTPMFELDGQD